MSSTRPSNTPTYNIITLLRYRQYGLTDRQSILSSIFHTSHSPLCSLSSVYKQKSLLSKSIKLNDRKFESRKRTVSENDENRRDSLDEKTSKRLRRSSEWIFGDSQLTLFKSISTIDNRQSIVDEHQTNYLSKSDEYLSNSHNYNRRYSSEKQQTIDTLSTLVLSQ